MALIDALRQQFPMYEDKNDEVLLEAYRSKYHPQKSIEDLEDMHSAKLAREEQARLQQEQDEQGFFSRAGDLLEVGGRGFVGESARGIATVADMLGGDSTDGLEQSLEGFADRQAEAVQDIAGIKPILEAEGVGDVISSGASYLAQSIPEMTAVSAAFLAGAKGGAVVGSAAGPVGAGVGGLIGGIGAGTAAGLMAFTGRNVTEFKNVNGRDPNLQEQQQILGTAAVQSSINTLLSRLAFAKGSGRTITSNMVQKGLAGTALEGATEGVQEALTIASANNYTDVMEALTSPENVTRLAESVLAGGAVGGGLGAATAPFTVDKSDPNQDLRDAAEGFVSGRPEEQAMIQGSPAVPQLTSQPNTPEVQPQRVQPVVDRDGNQQTQVLSGNQQPMLETEAEVSLTPDERARQTNAQLVQDITRRAIESGQDPLVALSDPQVEKQIVDAIDMEQEQEAIIAPTAQALAPQNTSKMTNGQLIEFAQQNSETDPVLSDIVNSEVPVPRKGLLIRRRLAELNVKPTTSLEQGQQVGDPILRKSSEVDEDGKVRRTVTEDTVQETDVATQPRMSRRKDTPESDALKAEIGPIGTRGLLEALKLRGGEASVRFTPEGLMDVKETERQTARYTGSVNYLVTRLNDLAGRGEQGKVAADAIKKQILDNKNVTADNIVGAFLAADSVVDTLGGQGAADPVFIRFFDQLNNAEGNAINGFKKYEKSADGKTKAVIELALDQSSDKVQQTAAHEAFHFLQDFYAAERPQDKKVLDAFYAMKDGKVNYKALPGSVKRLWKKYAPEAHKAAMAGKLPTSVASSPSEFQAMTFEYYKAAQAAGEANPLSGPMGGYFDFVSRFLPRLKNSLNGMGFQTAEDVFKKAATGKTSSKLEGVKLKPRQEAPMAQVAQQVGDEASQRDILNHYQGVMNNLEGLKDSDLDSSGGTLEFDIVYEAESGPASSLSFASGFDSSSAMFLNKALLSSEFANDPNVEGLVPQHVIDNLRANQGQRNSSLLEDVYNSNIMMFMDFVDMPALGDDAVVLRPTTANLKNGRVPMAMVRIDAQGRYTSARIEADVIDLDRTLVIAPKGTDPKYIGEDNRIPMYNPYSTTLRQLNEKLSKGYPTTTRNMKRELEVIVKKEAEYVSDLMGISEADKEKLGGDGDGLTLLNIDFRIDGSFDQSGSIPISREGMSKIYGSVIAGLRMAMDAIKTDGGHIDGIRFSGNDSARDVAQGKALAARGQKQRIYNMLARMPVFKEEFPELGEMITSARTSIMPKKDTLRDKAAAREAKAIRELEAQGELFDNVDDTVIFGGEASFRLDRVPDLTQVEPSPVNDDIANAVGLTPRERALSALDILYNPEFVIDIPEADTEVQEDGQQRPKNRLVGETGMGLHRKALAILGKPIKESNPETDELISKVMAAEVLGAMRNNPDTNAANWYTSSMARAIDAVAQLYPEIKTSKEHRSAFSTALSITSQGIAVDRNSAIGLAAYEFWRKNGRFPEYGEGEAAQAIQANFKTANKLLEAFNAKGRNFRFADFLEAQYTKREIIQALEIAGIPTKGKGAISLNGENMDTLLHGSFVFGPKIGQGFYQNLMGNFNPVTIDKWFMRTWGRYTGTLMGKPKYEQNIAELRDAMIEEGIEFDQERYDNDEQYRFDTVNRIAAMSNRFFKENREAIANKEVEKSTAMRRAEAAVTNSTKTNESPTSGTQREWIRSVVNRAREIVAKNGINLSSADLQAIIWYPEKDLYEKINKMGEGAKRLNQSYEDSYGELINGETGLRSVDGGRRFDAIRESIERADRESRQSTGGNGGQEASIRFGQGDYRTTNGMKQVLSDPTAKSLTRRTFGILNQFRDPQKRKQKRERFINEVVHGLRPIARREIELNERKTGERKYMPFAEGAFKITEIAQQLSGRMEMFVKFGAPVLNEDGTVTIDESTGGLQDIFASIGSGERYAQFQMYVYAQRAQRLKQEGRENLLTDAQIAEGMQYGAENPEFQRVFSNYKRFNERLMKFLEDTGSIDSETRKKLIGTADYVPFYRVMEEEQYTEGFFGRIKKPSDGAQNTTSAFDNPDARIKAVLRKLKGGDEKIGDLYENVFMNTQAIVGAGLRNVATQRIVKVMEELSKDGFYDQATKPKHISNSEASGNNNHFTYRKDGKTMYYDVGSDGEMITALRTFTPIQMQGFLRLMQNMGRFFRNAITITPAFMEANLIRGDMAGVVTVDAPLRPMIDTAIGLKNAIAETETVQEMKTIGGFGGYTFGESNVEFANKMKRFYRRHEGYDIIDTPQKLMDMMGTFVEKINKAGENTELATREAIYRRLIESGTDKGDAAYEALNLINYSRRGNPQSALAQSFAMLVPLVPFLNARIQGLYRTGTAFGREANAKNTAMKGATLLGLTLMYYAASSQNDEWDKEPLHRKLNYYIFYVGDKKYLVPKPFEIGAIFSTIPELFLDGIRKKDGQLVADGVTSILLNNFSFNPIPQAVKAPLEVAANYDFFRGRQLESLGVQGLPTEMRSYSNTSEFAKMAGKATSVLGISPIEFEQLVNGYTGSMGGYFLAGVDSILGEFGVVPEKPAGIFGDNIGSTAASALGITRFVKEQGNDPANQYLSDFYEMKREADEVVRGINRLREEGNYEDAMEMRKSNRNLIAVRSSLNSKYKLLNDINDRIQGVRASGRTPEEKKAAIDRLIRQRNRLVADMYRLKQRIRRDK